MSGLRLRRLAETFAFIVQMQASERRFRRHLRKQARHDESALRHGRAMAAELQWRVDLCARREGRPGPLAPCSGSGAPLVPPPSRIASGP